MTILEISSQNSGSDQKMNQNPSFDQFFKTPITRQIDQKWHNFDQKPRFCREKGSFRAFSPAGPSQGPTKGKNDWFPSPAIPTTCSFSYFSRPECPRNGTFRFHFSEVNSNKKTAKDQNWPYYKHKHQGYVTYTIFLMYFLHLILWLLKKVTSKGPRRVV